MELCFHYSMMIIKIVSIESLVINGNAHLFGPDAAASPQQITASWNAENVVLW